MNEFSVPAAIVKDQINLINDFVNTLNANPITLNDKEWAPRTLLCMRYHFAPTKVRHTFEGFWYFGEIASSDRDPRVFEQRDFTQIPGLLHQLVEEQYRVVSEEGDS